jgi:hypothetical protein
MMGWLFFGKRSSFPEKLGLPGQRQRPRLQLEQLEERMVLANRFQFPAGPLIDFQMNHTSAIGDADTPAVQTDRAISSDQRKTSSSTISWS